MSYRYCVYKDCQNYTVNQTPCGSRDFTMFKFPKDAERRKQWKELGDIHPCIAEYELFYCSDHFEQKFIAQNNRRRILVKEAMPIPYNEPAAAESRLSSPNVETQNPEISEQQDNYFILDHDDVVDDVQEHSVVKEENEYQVESTMQEDEDGNLIEECGAIDYCGDDNNYEEPSTSRQKIITITSPTNTIAYSRKRKLQAETVEKTTPTKTQLVLNNIKTYANQNLEKYIKIQAVKLTENVKRDESEQSLLVPKIPQKSSHQQFVESTKVAHTTEANHDVHAIVVDENTLIDQKHVSTFIFKGEEYVQMPKEHYTQEKIRLMQKIKTYENVLSKFKQQLSKLEFS